MVYNSLTKAPRNLKEGIDWLIALRGTEADDNLTALAEAIHNFLVDKPVGKMKVPALEKVKRISKTFLRNPDLGNLWPINEIEARFEAPLSKHPCIIAKLLGLVDYSDYNNAVQGKRLTAKTIAERLGNAVNGCEKFLENVKIPEQYKSAYSSKATWAKSCSKKPEACAVLFVGIAPMLYAGLRSLRKASYTATRRNAPFTAHDNMGKILKALGYVEPDCFTDMNASNVSLALKGLNARAYTILYDLAGFWAFY
ncbi:hypothetical protein BBBOND_0200740 [Babesia bigemina]|uniref:Uncharacterized protein n=1 Tax=Babesia bigemina TaxID=5866 RepID=A0A061D4D8_BABBI|nr:hypothetical protein BBBOND_0200740 [Babesia bigemina]CDR94917.1 hypothetical protein BBBOND_0200740 [Babesia bigemina]|eukprot:XP_012767103.1 hypothetical protein BBBOND_0200740 [Babesia bigemina]